MSGGGNPKVPGSGKGSDIAQKWPIVPRQFTAAEVANHNNKNDCWVIINKYIYDVTDWLDKHPGGSQLIFDYAGQDASDGYNSNHAPHVIFTTLPSSSFQGALKDSKGQLFVLPGQTYPEPHQPIMITPPLSSETNVLSTPKKGEIEGTPFEGTIPSRVDSSKKARKRAADSEYCLRMSHGWTVYDGTFEPMPQDKRRKRDVPHPSFLRHTYRSRAGLSNLQLSRDAPVSLCALDIAIFHIWKCMPAQARRYLHLVPPNGSALWGDDMEAVAAMYKRMDDPRRQYRADEEGRKKDVEPGKKEYGLFTDLKKRPWMIWPLWVEDKWGSGFVTVICYSENTPKTSLYNRLVFYSIIDPCRSREPGEGNRHGPIRGRMERIRNRLLELLNKAGFDTTAAEYEQVLCSPMPFNEATSGERCFAVVKALINQIIDWFTSGMRFRKNGTITNMQRWVNPFQQRVEMTGINAWILMASLDYNARISVDAILPNTITEVAADGVKKYVHPYDLAGPFDEPPLAEPDYFLPGGEQTTSNLE